jgi:hypothetical protein
MLEGVDQFDGREEAGLSAVMFDGLDAERGGDMGLAGSRPTDQHDVLGLIHELAAVQGPDSGLVDLAGGEVEAGEILARRRSPAAPMSVRRSTVEHPFGTIKSWTGPCHFLTQRLLGVRTEMSLNVLAYNIKRMIALVGIRRLIATIPG